MFGLDKNSYETIRKIHKSLVLIIIRIPWYSDFVGQVLKKTNFLKNVKFVTANDLDKFLKHINSRKVRIFTLALSNGFDEEKK